MVSGLADGPPSLRLPGDPLLQRLLLSARDLGRPLGPPGVPTPHAPPKPEEAFPRMYLKGVTPSFPFSASWDDYRSILRGLLASAFTPSGSSPPSIQRGLLRTQISLITQLFRAFQGKVKAHIRLSSHVQLALLAWPHFSRSPSHHHSPATPAFSSSCMP